jgi:hypothetical protein
MTLEQIDRLTKILDNKVEEGLQKLEDTPVESTSYNVILNNIISSTTLANKIRMDRSPLENETKTNTEGES